MNEFEKKLFADLQAGHSVDAILAEFNKHLNVAKAEVEAVKAREEEEKRKREEEEKKARAQRDVDAKKITEVANRALNNKLTGEDVAWMFQRYLFQKWGKSEAVCKVAMTGEDIDTMIDMAAKMFDTLEPLMVATNTKWEDLLNNVPLFTSPAKKQNKSKSDDEAIKDFLNKIL